MGVVVVRICPKRLIPLTREAVTKRITSPINFGNDVPDKPKYEQKESRKQRVIAELKHRYIFALLFAYIFIASTTILLGGVSGVFHSTCETSTWATAITSIVSAIGTMSATILTWRIDRRDAREKELKIALLEREVEAAR